VQYASFSPYGPPPQILHPTAPDDPSTQRLDASQVNLSFFIQLKIQILNHESIFHVTELSDRSNTRDAMEGGGLPQLNNLQCGRHHL
jgi:hypothetical protein